MPPRRRGPAAKAPQPPPEPVHTTGSLSIQLLREELAARQDFLLAYRCQLSQALTNSQPAHGRTPAIVPAMEDDSQLVALRTALEALENEASANKVLEIQARESADQGMARRLALQFDAFARRESLDHAFSRVLQETDNAGREDIDMVVQRGVEGVLGLERVRELSQPKSAPPQERPVQARKLDGKGKRPALNPGAIPLVRPSPHPAELDHSSKKVSGRIISQDTSKLASGSTPLQVRPVAPAEVIKCGICMDDCRISSTHAVPSRRAPMPQGVYIGPNTDKHAYCFPCLTTYIQTKLVDSTASKVFPINCPECKKVEITDELASQILTPHNMEPWYYRKLLDSSPSLFCPNRVCSVRVLLNEDGNPQAECPSCYKTMCTGCKSGWHKGMTCAQYQARPLHERDPEDIVALELAKSLNWRRCPACQMFIELESGCFHITCLCGTHSCYTCGSIWNRDKGRCSRNPPCELWDEDNLIIARAGAQHAQAPRQVAQPPPQRQAAPQQAAQPQRQPQRQALQAPILPDRVYHQAAPPLQYRYHPNETMMEHYAHIDAMDARQEEEEEEERERIRDDYEERLRQERSRVALQQYLAEEDVRMRGSDGPLDWIIRGVHTAHPFTQIFLLDLRCGYCNAGPYQHIEHLQDHLEQTTHEVFSCCDKFFRAEEHLWQHVDSRTRAQHNHYSRRDEALGHH